MARFTFTIDTDDGNEMAFLMGNLFPPVSKPRHVEPEPDPEAEEPVKRTRRKAAPASAKETGTTGGEITGDEEGNGDGAAGAQKPDTSSTRPASAVDDSSEDADEDDDDAGSEVTLDQIKTLGSQAMPKIRAAGLKDLLNQHGGGAASFGALDPKYYGAVHDALTQAIG